MSKEKREADVITRCWLKHSVCNRLCSLCGQRGVIYTSGTTSQKGGVWTSELLHLSQ
jgi:hypothetical protein